VEDPCRFHSPSAYTIDEAGQAVFAQKEHPSWTKVFSNALVDLARTNDKVVAITAAMPDGVGLDEFRKEFPKRYVDVGINESHAVAMAAGMAKAGLRPVVAVYSTFMHRAFDQVFQELSLQDLPVVLCMDRAGLVGSDGAVHHGFADVAIMRSLPGMVIMAPADAGEMKQCLALALKLEGPSAIRYPRDEAPNDIAGPCRPFELGKGQIVRTGANGTILCYGTMLEPALAAADMLLAQNGLRVGVVNARFVKPLDVPLVTRLVSSGKPLVCCEEHAIAGGFGSAVLELAASRGLDTHNVRILGLPDRYITHASRQEQLAEVGLEPANIAATIKEMILAGPAKKLNIR
jgi:1-deoxy-D-xylulose-5-phosphate synthase